MTYRRILLPTDFSEAANQALAVAFAEGTQHQAHLTLLHVMQRHPLTEVFYIGGAPNRGDADAVDSGGQLPANPRSEAAARQRDYQEEALAQLRQLVPRTFSGPWEAQVALGEPADTIVRVANDLGVDLIIIATHGRTGSPHILLGSVAIKVVLHAACPVLTVRYKKTNA